MFLRIQILRIVYFTWFTRWGRKWMDEASRGLVPFLINEMYSSSWFLGFYFQTNLRSLPKALLWYLQKSKGF